MLSQEPLDTRTQFLKEFTLEILLTVKKIKAQKDAAVKEAARLKRAINSEKLKIKYAEPEETKKQEEKIKTQKKVLRKKDMAPSVYSAQKIPTEENHIPVMPPISLMPPISPHPVAGQIQPNIYATQPEMDFGKINLFIKDIGVSSIECQGDNKEIIVRKNNQIMKTEVKLSREEIDKIINDFSEKARIPLIEGLLRARLGNLQMYAIVSKAASSRFIITKIYLPQPKGFENLKPAPSILQKPMPFIPEQRRAMPPMPPIQRPFTNQFQKNLINKI